MDNQDLEPEAQKLLEAGKEIADAIGNSPALYSIAISLKRIADNLDKSKEFEPFQGLNES